MEKIAKNCIKGNKWFYFSPITSDIITVEGPEFKHITKVMRLNLEDCVQIFDGKGTIASGKITEITKNSVMILPESIETIPNPNTQRPIIIAASVAKKDRFEWLISKCTELGVDHIYPVIFERTVKQPGNEKKLLERYNTLALNAAKQCQRLYLPKIASPATLAQTLAKINENYHDPAFLTGSLDCSADSIDKCFQADSPLVALIGPEGGMTSDEINYLENNGSKPVKLTRTILRIETAAIAFASILCTLRDSR